MKKYVLLLGLLLMGSGLSLFAQKWSDLTDEEKMMKLESFRDDNQNYLKNTLKMTEDQLADIDNVNICYLSTLDRIDRYAKTDADKEKYAKAVTAARSAQLDAIMGVEKRKQFAKYVEEKLKKAKGTKK
ncbi:hypothetical protein [Flavisolibacter tropicus]|uniref:Uncharacterized protein n=1 Tax=Flavisolibacter tropicus TaxID=1492898 RepID=A0A172TXJ1_9BACT|nr:hypothetical protein [Flavisolibacter tropicus]ANE51702.1 hypothetical protein SY85_15530 [Flavisolibacter tropicus]